MENILDILINGFLSLFPLFAVIGAQVSKVKAKRSEYECEKKAGYLFAGSLICMAYCHWSFYLITSIGIGVLVLGIILLTLSAYFATKINKEKSEAKRLQIIIKEQFLEGPYFKSKVEGLSDEELEVIAYKVYQKCRLQSTTSFDDENDELFDEIIYYARQEIEYKQKEKCEEKTNGKNDSNI